MAENVKNMFISLAKYNSKTNQDVINKLEQLEPDKLIKDVGSYYGSILGILNHMMLADISWLRAYGKYIPSLESLTEILNKFRMERKPPKELHWSNLEEYKLARIEIDHLIEKLVQQLAPNLYITVVKMESKWRGTIEFELWRYLLHLFNHHTHHRGGVAVILDQLNVENDYSNLLWK